MTKHCTVFATVHAPLVHPVAAGYSSFRDVSSFVSSGAAWLVLLMAPLSGVFSIAKFDLFAASVIAGRPNRRLGWRMSRSPAPASVTETAKAHSRQETRATYRLRASVSMAPSLL